MNASQKEKMNSIKDMQSLIDNQSAENKLTYFEILVQCFKVIK